MFSAYGTLFRTPGGLKFSIAGVIGRMPIAMDSLALIFIVVAASGSYAIAGALSAVASIIISLSGPFWARMADQKGQRRIILTVLPLRLAGFSLFIFLVLSHAPIWSWFLSIILAELTSINTGGLIRSRWLHVLSPDKSTTAEDESDRHIINTAYSYEAIMDEVVFIIGPIIAITLATSIAPSAGVFAGMAFIAIGLPALAAQRATEPPPAPRHHKSPHPPVIKNKSVQAIVIPTALVGGFFGAIAIAVVAFAEAHGAPAKAAIILALWAVGSAIAAVINGVIKWKVPPAARFIIFLVALTLLSLPMIFVGNVLWLTIALFFNGFAVAPLIVNAYAVVESAVPTEQITETLTWVVAGMPLGGAASIALTGWVIEKYGVEAAFLVPAGFLIAAILATLPYFSTYQSLIGYARKHG